MTAQRLDRYLIRFRLTAQLLNSLKRYFKNTIVVVSPVILGYALFACQLVKAECFLVVVGCEEPVRSRKTKLRSFNEHLSVAVSRKQIA